MADPMVVAVFGPPPDGMNLADDQSTANAVVAVVCAVIATVSLVLRLWAKMSQRASVTADDALIFIALIFVYGTCALTIMGGHYGSGKHLWANNLPDVSMVFKLLYAYTYVYAGSVSFTKLGILLFYRRIFQRGSKSFFYRLYFAAFMCTGYPLAIWFTMAGICNPVSQFWTQFIGTQGTCVDVNAAFLTMTVINMVNDIIVLVVPIPEILQLQMSFKKKIGVCGIMLLGSFVCVVSCVRIWAFVKFIHTTDLTWATSSVFLWSSIEPAAGILSACLPNMRPLFRRAKDKITSASKSHGDTSNSGNWARSKNDVRSYVRFGDDQSSSHEDEVALTKISKGQGSLHTTPENVIVVRSEIKQTS
ncbi:hypothetical protein F5B20DRAFT_95011 [Whalleya microplaca]|nr:hypothetical protein F5B20DRAFT_95011 [Whalleya microplaca]